MRLLPTRRRSRDRTPRTRRTAAIAAVIGAVGLAAACGGADPAGFTARGEPAPLPDAQLVEVDAEGFEAILVGLRGRPVLVNVWATWCVPCRAEAPLLRRAAEADPDLVVLGLHADDDVEGAREFLADFDLTHPNVSDDDGDVTRLLGVTSFPTTIVWDAEGRQRARTNGGFTEQRLAAMLAEVRGP